MCNKHDGGLKLGVRVILTRDEYVDRLNAAEGVVYICLSRKYCRHGRDNDREQSSSGMIDEPMSL